VLIASVNTVGDKYHPRNAPRERKVTEPVDYAQLLLLGAIAGFTIFLGLPLALLQQVSWSKKSFLNAIAIGILVFLVFDVFSHAWSIASGAAETAFAGATSAEAASIDLIAVFGGIAIGLMGLVLYESRYMSRVTVPQRSVSATTTATVDTGTGASLIQTVSVEEIGAYRLAMMIAVGIGAHNFSEGLAIGQSYAAGSLGLALILIIGFGAHNATEGFGISSPLTRLEHRPNARFLVTIGLVGGAPTFLGTLVGSLIGVSDFTYILFLSVAGGALVYVSMLMYNTARRHATNRVVMSGVFVGLCLGFLTDLIVSLGGA
jgi:ZIP family zinc transporter